jgi:hypothetical protein
MGGCVSVRATAVVRGCRVCGPAPPPPLLQREASGCDDLADVVHLELTVDTTDQSVARVGEYCPNLRELKLNDSVLQSIRDLGTSVRNLQVLWLARCGVADLDGIGILDNLKELYLSFNNIEDIGPLSMHEHLEVGPCLGAVGCARYAHGWGHWLRWEPCVR